MGDSVWFTRDQLAQLDPRNERTVLKIEMGPFNDGNMHVVLRFDDGSDLICRQDPETGLFAIVQYRRAKWGQKVEGIIDVPEMIRMFLTPGETLKIGIIPADEDL